MASSVPQGRSQPQLEDLRSDIDRIDDQLLRLIEERLSKTKAIAELKRSTDRSALLLRPDRERLLLDRLKQRSSLPAAVVEAIWREIMACSLQLQQETELAIFAPKRPVALVNLARLRFGCAAPIHVAASPEEALDRARSRPSIATIELHPISNWWTELDHQQQFSIFDCLTDEHGQIAGLLVGRCDSSCRLPDLSFPVLTADALSERAASGEKIEALAHNNGDLRLCVSRGR